MVRMVDLFLSRRVFANEGFVYMRKAFRNLFELHQQRNRGAQVMFGFVSRKEFDILDKTQDAIIKVQNDQALKIAAMLDKIAKLEAANNCRDGKHEWVYYVETTEFSDIASVFVPYESNLIKPHQACKHCGVERDKWENNQIATTYDSLKDLKKAFPIKRKQPQPKRKRKK